MTFLTTRSMLNKRHSSEFHTFIFEVSQRWTDEGPKTFLGWIPPDRHVVHHSFGEPLAPSAGPLERCLWYSTILMHTLCEVCQRSHRVDLSRFTRSRGKYE